MLDARTGRTRVTTAALPWATRPGARAGRERRSAAEPCLLWSTESSVINILPLKTHVKYRSIPPPARDYPFKLEVTFCVRGVTTAPCGVPTSVFARPLPPILQPSATFESGGVFFGQRSGAR